jgi:membrane protease YdiL (CAAX protease family)
VPPAWPAWILAFVGLAVTLAGTAWLLFAATLDPAAAGWAAPAVVTGAGGLALLGSLVWLAERGIRARRPLPAIRYRGPSIILLFFLAVTAANLLSVPLLVATAAAGEEITNPDPFSLIVLLLVTPVIFAAVGALFVIRPRALAGVRFGDGPATVANVARGVALGAAAWVAAAALAAVLGWIVTAITGEEPTDSQVVAQMAATLPPVVAIALIGLLAPAAEEFFFRWVAVNAWEREHGGRAAVLGSAVLFGAAHLLGGSPLALPPIFLLGLILAGAYITTRSLPLVVGVHATFNCLSLAVLFLAGG